MYDTRFHFVVNIQYITVKITGLDVVKCNNVNKKTVVPNVNWAWLLSSKFQLPRKLVQTWYALYWEKKRKNIWNIWIFNGVIQLWKAWDHQRLSQIPSTVTFKNVFIHSSYTAVGGFTAVFIPNKANCNKTHHLFLSKNSYTAGRNKIFRSVKRSSLVMESHGISHEILHQGSTQQEPWEALHQPLVLSRCWV